MEEALQKRIKIKEKKCTLRRWKVGDVPAYLCDGRAYFLKFTMFLLSAGSLAIRGIFNNIKKYEENER